MTRVYMIRHGKPASTWGDHGGDPDPGLDASGLSQAEAAARALMAFEPPLRPSRVVTSPLRRCVETSQPLALALGVAASIEPAVAEIPTPAGLSLAERGPWLRRSFLGTWQAIEGDIDYRSWRDGVAQAVIRHAGAAIFSHYVAINAAVSAATGSEAVAAFQPDHASITIFEVKDGALTVVERGRPAVTSVL